RWSTNRWMLSARDVCESRAPQIFISPQLLVLRSWAHCSHLVDPCRCRVRAWSQEAIFTGGPPRRTDWSFQSHDLAMHCYPNKSCYVESRGPYPHAAITPGGKAATDSQDESSRFPFLLMSRAEGVLFLVPLRE